MPSGKSIEIVSLNVFEKQLVNFWVCVFKVFHDMLHIGHYFELSVDDHWEAVRWIFILLKRFPCFRFCIQSVDLFEYIRDATAFQDVDYRACVWIEVVSINKEYCSTRIVAHVAHLSFSYKIKFLK